MAKTQAILRYRPEEPLYLNQHNTDAKTETVALYYVEQLRSLGWLCVYKAETVRPLHLSFLDMSEFEQFKRDCNKLKIVLKSPTIKADEIPQLDNTIIPAESSSTYEDVLGNIKST